MTQGYKKRKQYRKFSDLAEMERSKIEEHKGLANKCAVSCEQTLIDRKAGKEGHFHNGTEGILIPKFIRRGQGGVEATTKKPVKKRLFLIRSFR